MAEVSLRYVIFLNRISHLFIFFSLFHRHWLFGEKIFDEPEEPRNGTKKDKKKKQQQQQQSEPLPEAHKPPRIRGWFPRQCAVELVEDEDEAEQQQHFNEKKKHK